MSRQGTRLAAILVAAALAFALAACGGSSSESSPSSSEGSTATTTGTGGEGGSGGGQKSDGQPGNGSEGGGGSGGDVETSPLRVSGGGSGQFRVKGGDNSIQDFGDEASESELEEAAKALHDFYVARAREEWSRACANLSKTVAEQLEQLAERAKQGKQTGCPAALAAITPGLPPKVARETTVIDAGSLRVEGDRGFLIYRGEEGTAYAINMAREDGWKVGALAGIPLS